MATHKDPAKDYSFGLSGIELAGRTFDFGHGIQVRPAFAHLFSAEILSFERPASPNSHHPGPWQAVSHAPATDITAELFIPAGYRHSTLSAFDIAQTIVVLLRVAADPAIGLQIATEGTLATLKDRQVSEEGKDCVGVMVLSHRERQIAITLVNRDRIFESIDWVVAHWEHAVALQCKSPEFAFALATFDNAQLIPNTAMMLVSVWGALEAIFAPHKAELVFRVSAQLACYLTERGLARMEKQKEIVKLYNLRSAAAHGSPKHHGADIIRTFELLRNAIVKMVEQRSVPTKEALEHLLFAS